VNVRVLSGLQRTARPPDDWPYFKILPPYAMSTMQTLWTNAMSCASLTCPDASRSLILAAQPSRRSSGALLHLEFYAAETLHQIEQLAIDLDRIDRRPTGKPLAPTPGIGGAPLPKGGSFLNHGLSRSALAS